ncbi:hypothetical protein Tco_0916765, partial [Tanacetum coccineum]
ASRTEVEIAKEEICLHETHERLVTEKPSSEEDSDESEGEPANRPIGKRRTSDTIQAIKASRKINRSQPRTEGSSEGASITPEVPDESVSIFTTLSEGTGITLGVPDEEKGSSEAKVDCVIDWGLENESDYFEKYKTNDEDEYVEYKARNDEYVHKDEYVHDGADKEMKDAEDDETGKDDAAKADAKKIEKVKGADNQSGIKVVNVDQAKDTSAQDNQATAFVSETSKEMLELPSTSSRLSVSSGFSNQFLNLSSDISLMGVVKDSTDEEINSLLDIQIQQEVPQIQSPTLLNVPVFIILEQPVPAPSPALTTETPISMVLSHPPYVITITHVQQQTTPIPTPPITTKASLVATKVPNPPLAIETGSSLGDTLQKVLQKHTEELKQELKQQESHKSALEIIKIKQEHVSKQKWPKHSTTPFDKPVENEYKQKDILFKMMMASKLYEKHYAHKALYDALIQSLFMDKDDMYQAAAAMDQSAQWKRKHDDQTKTLLLDQTKGRTIKGQENMLNHQNNLLHPRNPLKIGNVEEKFNGEVAPKIDNAPKNDWFKQPPRPPISDPEWNKCQVVNQPEQTWFNDLVSAQKDPLIFDELMATPIDFSKSVKNRLKLDKITKAYLALFDQLDWTNPKGDRCLFDLSKPLLLKAHPGHLTIASGYFFNNDLEYLKSKDSKRKYTTSTTKMKAASGGGSGGVEGRVRESDLGDRVDPVTRSVFGLDRKSPPGNFSGGGGVILSVVSVKVDKLHGYGYLEEIVVRRADRQLYKFKEGDFVNLYLNDIEDMILLIVQHKLFQLDGDVIVDLAMALRMFTRSLIIKKRVEDVQLGVESYQKKLNSTKP